MSLTNFEENFCGGEFWNDNITWNTDNPDFTPCFHKTILSWTPSLIFLVFVINESRKYRKSSNRNIPWNFWFLLKFLLTCMLIVLAITELVFTIIIDKDDNALTEIHPVDYTTVVVFILTYVG